MKNNPLPAAYSRFGSFDRLAQDNNERINGILTELLRNNYARGTVEQKLSDFYKLAMDSTRRNNEGVKPVMPLLKEIERCKTKYALRQLQLKYAAFAYGVPMSTGWGADEKNAGWNILNVYQGGLTLGQKEYYLDNDSATTAIREAYKKHIVNMFRFFGYNQKAATLKMNDVLAIETKVAEISKSRTELRDVEANYNKMTMDEFERKYPNIHLTELMVAEGMTEEQIKEIVVGQPSFMEGVDKIIADMTPGQLKSYMEWDVIHSSASLLSDEVQAESFDFFGKTMTGRQEDHPRWKRATNQVQSVMGQALGKIYVEKYFPAAAKERMLGLVKNLQEALAERIDAQEWMSDSTKAYAKDKLASFYVKIGYPNKWKDYSKLTIDPEKTLYENMQAVREWASKKEVEDKYNKPVDRDEWYMTPQTVNAYYNPTTNEICFPAGILQYPFFDMQADDAFNYGAIGVVIGHEMTHGFDDQGRQFDKEGNFRDWWAAGDGDKFKERAQVMSDFFSNIEVLPGLHGNGELTLGENLADHGGLQVAFTAFQNAQKKATKPLGVVDGFTPEQRFFLAYAGVWAQNITEEAIRDLTARDPHSLGEWRVNGALPHIDAWYDAFGITDKDPLFVPKEKRVTIW